MPIAVSVQVKDAPTLNDATHAYCPVCDCIQPAIFEALEEATIDGRYLGGDILCTVCHNVIASLYRTAR